MKTTLLKAMVWLIIQLLFGVQAAAAPDPSTELPTYNYSIQIWTQLNRIHSNQKVAKSKSQGLNTMLMVADNQLSEADHAALFELIQLGKPQASFILQCDLIDLGRNARWVLWRTLERICTSDVARDGAGRELCQLYLKPEFEPLEKKPQPYRRYPAGTATIGIRG